MKIQMISNKTSKVGYYTLFSRKHSYVVICILRKKTAYCTFRFVLQASFLFGLVPSQFEPELFLPLLSSPALRTSSPLSSLLFFFLSLPPSSCPRHRSPYLKHTTGIRFHLILHISFHLPLHQLPKCTYVTSSLSQPSPWQRPHRLATSHSHPGTTLRLFLRRGTMVARAANCGPRTSRIGVVPSTASAERASVARLPVSSSTASL